MALSLLYIGGFCIAIVLLIAVFVSIWKIFSFSKESSARAKSQMLSVISLIIAACYFATLPMAVHEAWDLLGNAGLAIAAGVLMGLYNALAMFFFESNLATLQAFLNQYVALLPSMQPFASGYVVFLAVLYTLAPIGIAATAISMFKGRVSLIIAVMLMRNRARNSRIYLFDGISDKSLAFVKNLRMKTDNPSNRIGVGAVAPLVVFANVSKNAEEKASGEIKALSCRTIRFIDADCDTLLRETFRGLHGKAFWSLHVFFFGDDSGLNLGSAIGFMRSLAAWTSPYGDRTCSEADLRAIDRMVEGKDATQEQIRNARALRFTDEGAPRYHIYCSSRGRSDEQTLDSVVGIRGFDIRIVDEARAGVYDLMWNHPLHKTLPPHYLLLDQGNEDARRANLVVIILGAGDHGFEAFRAACWLGQIVDVDMTIFVIDRMSRQDFFNKVDYWCPQLRNNGCFSSWGMRTDASEGHHANVRFWRAAAGERSFNEALREVHGQVAAISQESEGKGFGKVVPYCVVSLGEDDLSTDAALSLRQAFCGSGDGAEQLISPKIYVNVKNHSKHPVIERMNGTKLPLSLIPYGSLDRIFTEESIVASPQEALAFAVHSSFSTLHDGQSDREKRIEDFLSYTRWQMGRLSSTANALAMRSKLWAFGLDMEMNPIDMAEASSRNTSLADYGGSAQHFLEAALDRMCQPLSEQLRDPLKREQLFASDCKLARMARAEHDRWLALYLTEGWISMSPKASMNFRLRGMSDGRHDSHLLMRHPFIAPFDRLGRISQLVGKEDTRLHDVYSVTNMKAILSSQMGYGLCRYKATVKVAMDPGLYLLEGVSRGTARIFRKKPGTAGFHAFAIDDDSLVFHNRLEDGTDEAPGVFVCGLMGEVWKIENLPLSGKMRLSDLSGDCFPEKFNARYVIDCGEGPGRNIRFDDLKELPVPKDWEKRGTFRNPIEAMASYGYWNYDFSSCCEIRYRREGDEPPVDCFGGEKAIPAAQYILAVKAGEEWAGACIKGTYAEYWINRSENVWGDRLEHGGGDWIVCSLADCAGRSLPSEIPVWCERGEDGEERLLCPEVFLGCGSSAERERPYVINGAVFQKTYEIANSLKRVR
ncbi:MAG: hypothetical protein ACI4B9_03265 [Eggerthellaceae bacterium]